MIYNNKEKDLVKDYVVFDLETTGLDPKSSEIIEIGALKYINDELVDEFSVLIKPKDDIPSEITNITGIDDEMVKDALSIKEILPQFIDFIGNLTLIAHNSSFDLSFIEENILKLDLPMIDNKNIDTVNTEVKQLHTTSDKITKRFDSINKVEVKERIEYEDTE